MDQEGLNAQEAAYFESGGTQTEGLVDASPSSSEPVQQPENQPEAQPEQQTQQQQEQQTEQQRTVPLAALQEERAERKRLRDQVNQMQEQQNALVQRILASQQAQQPQQAAPQIPDFNTDPVGHLRAQNDLLQRQLQQVTGYLGEQNQQQQQLTQQQAAQHQLMQTLIADEGRFRTQTPDYDAAAAFLQNSRAAEYRALGMTNPMEIQQALQADIAAMVNIAQRNGTSVAESAYNLAKARGYKAAQAPQGAAQQQDNAARLAAVSQGQQHAQSLGSTGGAAPSPMSIEKLLAMSDADFAKATSGTNWQKLNAELSAR